MTEFYSRSTNVIDAETGKPVDSYTAQAAEKTVAGWAYPAVLPSRIRRMLAFKLVEINRITGKNSREIDQMQVHEYESKAFTDLTKAQQRDIAAYNKAKALIEALQIKFVQEYKLNDYFIHKGQTHVRVYRGQETIQRERNEKKAKAFKCKAEHETAIEAFKVLLKEVADAELARVKKKVGADLVARLDAIGPERQLLAANPAHPKTETELMIDQVLAGTIDPAEAHRQMLYRTGISAPVEDIIDLDARTVEREKREMEKRDRKIARAQAALTESRSVQRRKAVQRKGRS